MKIQDLPPAETVEDFDALPDDVYTAPLSLTKGLCHGNLLEILSSD